LNCGTSTVATVADGFSDFLPQEATTSKMSSSGTYFMMFAIFSKSCRFALPFEFQIKEGTKSPLFRCTEIRIYMDEAGKIKELAESALKELSTDGGHFIVDVLYFEKQRPAKLMIIVDGDNGVTIDTCANLSRKLSALLDEQNVPDNAYVLEVTTPGVDQPLKMKRQYFKNAGRQFKVQLKDKTIVQGKLEEVTDEKLNIRQVIDKKETKLVEVPFNQIEKAFVMVSFK
jgi:ribosome maturation factor RimP